MFARRSYGQRTVIVCVAAVLLAAVWWYVPDLATRIALTAILGLASPALIVLTFDRRT